MQPTTAASNSRIFHDLDFERPGKRIGYLRVPQSRDGGAWSTIEIPIAVINGAPGPSVLFTGGVHGDEYEGQIAVSRLARTLDAQSVRGRVILMPAVDLPAALAGRRMCPIVACPAMRAAASVKCLRTSSTPKFFHAYKCRWMFMPRATPWKPR